MGTYTIPAGVSFLTALGRGILDLSQEQSIPLPEFRILLPHRRACRELQEIFLDLSEGKPLLLPQIHPIGEVDEDELSLIADEDLAAKILEIPPSISPMRRQFLLMRLVQKVEYGRTGHEIAPDHALRLARALAQFMDQVILEDLSYDRLDQIVPAEFAEHWGITVEFLKILSDVWPQILSENNLIEAAERRNKLLRLQAEHWKNTNPEYPIIAAGSTGTMKATSDLMGVIHTLPHGMVVLPGLDTELDRTSWDAIEASHPQKTMQELLNELSIERAHIQIWRGAEQSSSAGRRFLAREIMRPAATAEEWQNISPEVITSHKMDSVLNDIRRIDCETLDQEAKVIALKLREVSETPGRTAALVTPDRVLARQVQQICKRWNIELDDTAGSPLSNTALGRFISLPLDVLREGYRPSILLALLKHPLCGYGYSKADIEIDIKELERPQKLRGALPKDMRSILAPTKFGTFLDTQEKQLKTLHSGTENPARSMILAHITFLEALAQTPYQTGTERLWTGDYGEAAALFFSKLLQETDIIGDVSIHDYAEIITTLLRDLVVRPKYGMHPRLMILGQIEARLVQSDVMILGGLNEGTWPPDPGNDPWMSRPMRKAFGLPDPDRAIGLSAHDFVQAFSAKEVLLTRSVRVDSAPTVPARWLERLDTVLSAMQYDPAIIHDHILPHFAELLDQPDGDFSPATRPQPTPPSDARPSQLPVTAIEKWMRDPYAIYARYVLGLRKLDPVEQEADAALKGSWIHDILRWIVDEYPNTFPENIIDIIMEHAENDPDKPASYTLWYPRFRHMMEWFIAHEKTWRKEARPLLLEQEGRMMINGLTLTAKADRIDLIHANSKLAVIDYKTGSPPKKKEVQSGLAPQLSLEALILRENGFSSIQDKTADILSYWKISGGKDASKEERLSGPKFPSVDKLCDTAYEGVASLVQTFSNPNMPYICLPDPEIAPPDSWQDYAQLARVAEWATLDDTEGGDS